MRFCFGSFYAKIHSVELLAPYAPILAALLALGFALALGVVAIYVATSLIGRTLPSRVRTIAEEALEASTRAIAACDQQRQEWAAVLEEIDNLSEQIESRRKRVQQQAARAEAALLAGGPANGAAAPQIETLEQAKARLLGS